MSARDTDRYLRVNDLKSYVYCPRIAFYTLCLRLNCSTPSSRLGAQAEIEVKEKIKRRVRALHTVVEGERQLNIMVFSHTLHLVGRIDEVVQTANGIHLIDYKDTDHDHGYWKMQMQGYVICAEETLGQPVLGAWLYIIPDQTYQPVTLTAQDRCDLEATLAAIRTMVERETCPPPTPHAGKCRVCPSRRFCNDVE